MIFVQWFIDFASTINQFQLYIIVAVKKIMSCLCSILQSLALSIETERPLYNNENLYLKKLMLLSSLYM